MTEQYRLVFSAEVADGQHPAVVKKRLAAVLKLDDAQMDVLFSGQPVVVKKATDKQNAARYQEAFKKAGARLRVLPLDKSPAAGQQAAPKPSPTPAPSAQNQPPTESGAPSSGGLHVLPVGSDLLDPSERPSEVEADIDTSHLQVQGAVFATPSDDDDTTLAPDVDHLTLAELGATLGVPQTNETLVAEIEVDFSLAEVGAIIGQLEREEQASIDMDAVDFDLAEPGADLDERSKPAPPAPPDTSHLSVDDPERS